jgi:hypothetical protein
MGTPRIDGGPAGVWDTRDKANIFHRHRGEASAWAVRNFGPDLASRTFRATFGRDADGRPCAVLDRWQAGPAGQVIVHGGVPAEAAPMVHVLDTLPPARLLDG